MASPLAGSRAVVDAALGAYQFPTALEPCTPDVATELGAALAWASRSADAIESRLSEVGALIFRGFPFDTAEDFAALTEALGYPNFAYEGAGGNAVRERVVGDRVFTANEAPPERAIPFHHELAQCAVFPERVLFFCDVPAAVGGATPILDSALAYEKLRELVPAFMDDLEARGVRYTRVMTADDRPESAIGRGWARTFAVESADALERALAGTGERVEWLDAEALRAERSTAATAGNDRALDRPLRHFSARRDAVLVDPLDPLGKRRFFNQILAAHAGWRDELNAPGEAVVFGDGGAMPAEAFEAMEAVFREAAVAVPWRHGDVMLLNNLQVMHSRERFEHGEKKRRVLASLAAAPRRTRRGDAGALSRAGRTGATASRTRKSATGGTRAFGRAFGGSVAFAA